MRSVARAIAIIVLAFALVGCGARPGTSPGPTPTPVPSPSPSPLPSPTIVVDSELDAEIATQLDLWRAAGIDDYTFEITRSCFCPPEAIGPFLVTVEDGVPTSVLFEGQPADEQLITGVPLTIDATFERLLELDAAARVVVAWDEEHGFLTQADVDPIPNAIDDEFSLIVTAFTPAS